MAKGKDGSRLTHFVLNNEGFKLNFTKIFQTEQVNENETNAQST